MYSTLVRWYGKKTVLFISTILISTLAYTGYHFTQNNSTAEEAETTAAGSDRPLVETASVSTLRGETQVSLLGTVASIDRAALESEAAGRVTGVSVELGQQVNAGAVIARLENASERAAVLQAEGAYEAAVAQAAQSDLGVAEAENNVNVAQNNLAAAINDAVSVNRGAYTTANSIVHNQMDQFFSNPNGPGVIGLRIDGAGYTSDVVETRRALRELLPQWQNESTVLSEDDAVQTALETSLTRIRTVTTMVDQFIAALSEADATPRFTSEALAQANSNFSNARSQLNAELNSLENALTAVENARQSLDSAQRALDRARLGGTGSTVSSADAQVKQALGSLRSAEAALEKTIIRSPIAGTVNELDVQVGDFLANRDRVAVIANNQALEITTYVSERDAQFITEGDKVAIEDAGDGTITTIAPAVNEQTGKREVKIQSTANGLQTGDTVDIIITNTQTDESASNTPSLLPITAVRFTADDGYVFTIEDDVLVRNDVTLGRVRGSQVEVTAGLTRTSEIVVDARGLAAGQAVEIATNN